MIYYEESSSSNLCVQKNNDAPVSYENLQDQNGKILCATNDKNTPLTKKGEPSHFEHCFGRAAIRNQLNFFLLP